MTEYFYEYGELEYMEPEEYFSGPWVYVGTAWSADHTETYDLVRNKETDEMRWTNI